MALVRPDQVIGWLGDSLPANFRSLIDTLRGLDVPRTTPAPPQRA
ncbi:hypothetical protein [Streptomyces sp. KL116D]